MCCLKIHTRLWDTPDRLASVTSQQQIQSHWTSIQTTDISISSIKYLVILKVRHPNWIIWTVKKFSGGSHLGFGEDQVWGMTKSSKWHTDYPELSALQRSILAAQADSSSLRTTAFWKSSSERKPSQSHCSVSVSMNVSIWKHTEWVEEQFDKMAFN